MDLQLVHKLLDVFDRHGRDILLGHPQSRFRLLAELREFLQSVGFFSHHITLLNTGSTRFQTRLKGFESQPSA
jgi:hypothetical protein